MDNLPENEISSQIVDSVLKVHKALGPGLLESLYEECLCEELAGRRLVCARQVEVPVLYNQKRMRTSLRLYLLVEDSVIVEVKSVDFVLPIHKAQILTYMKLARKPLGLLVNFNVPLAREGISRHIMREFSKDSAHSAGLCVSGVN